MTRFRNPVVMWGVDEMEAMAPGEEGGHSLLGTAVAEYNFAVHGGAIGAIPLGVFLPDNAIITDSLIDVITTFTTAGADAGTIALHVQAANDIVSAIAVSNGGDPWDAGLHAGVPVGTAATAIKLTAKRQITATVAGQAVTAGRLRVYLFYVLSK